MDLSQQIERLNELEQQLTKEIQFDNGPLLSSVKKMASPLWWKQSLPLSSSKSRKKIVNLQKEHNRFLQKRLDLLKNRSRYMENQESKQVKRFKSNLESQKENLELLEQENALLEEIEKANNLSSFGLNSQDNKSSISSDNLLTEAKHFPQKNIEQEVGKGKVSEVAVFNEQDPNQKTKIKTALEKGIYQYKVDYLASATTPEIKPEKGYFAIRQNSVTVFYYNEKGKSSFFSQLLENIISELKKTLARSSMEKVRCIDVVHINAKDCDEQYLSNLMEKNKKRKDMLQDSLKLLEQSSVLEKQPFSSSRIALSCMLTSINDSNKIYVFEEVENTLSSEDLNLFTSCLSMNKNNTIVLFTSKYMIAKKIIGARVYSIS